MSRLDRINIAIMYDNRLYVDRDSEIIDYQGYYLNSVDFLLRGPEPTEWKEQTYFSCIGAAQTFGTYVEFPFGHLLSMELNTPYLNFGIGGKGPDFFTRQKGIIEHVNHSAFCILQIMSSRSIWNSFYEKIGFRLYEEPYIKAFEKLIADYPLEYIESIINEIRNQWLDAYLQLFEMIKVPVVLFWFSTREPDYPINYRAPGKLLGKFPQLVNGFMMDQIKDKAEKYVECISQIGLPEKLINRHTKEPVNIYNEMTKRTINENKYYPSTQMHREAAELLTPVCKSLLKNDN